MSTSRETRTALVAAVRRTALDVLQIPAMTARLLVSPPTNMVDVMRTLRHLLWRSLPVACVVTLFTGAMLTVTAAIALRPFGGASFAGLIVGIGGMREVFPLLACGVVGARTGADDASEIAAMRAGEQLLALETMGLDPRRLVFAPRLWACMLGTPIVVLAASAMGMIGSQLVGTLQLGIDPGHMWSGLWRWVRYSDIGISVVKGLLLGALIAGTSVREGLLAEIGPAGIGNAANRAVVRSMVAVCLGSLAITAIVYGVRS